MAKRTVPEHILDILRGLSIDGHTVRITSQLSREAYVAVDTILKDLGGKWNRSQRAHVFTTDPQARLAEILGSEQFESRAQKFGFFPTPKALADKLVKAADIRPGMTVLEPSAGSGRIVDALLDTGVEKIIAIEVQPELMAALRKKYFPSPAYDKRPMTLREGDFLTIEPWKTVDRVVMNPPFTKGADAKHVLRAYEWLSPGGKLAAIVSSMAGSRSDATSAKLGKLVAEHGKEQTLPGDSFKEAGTNVATKLIVVTKPKSAPMPKPTGRPFANEGYPIGAAVLIDGVDLAIIKQSHLNGCSNFAFPHYHVDLVSGETNVVVAPDKVGVQTRPDALVRMNDPAPIRNLEGLPGAGGTNFFKFLLATQDAKGGLTAQRWARTAPVAEPGEVVVVFTSDAYQEAMRANDYRTTVKPSPGLSSVEDLSGPVDELILWAENTGEIYPQRRAIEEKIIASMQAGTYDHQAAIRMWTPWMLEASRNYRKQFGRSLPAKVIEAATAEYANQQRDSLSYEAKTDQPSEPIPAQATPTSALKIKWTPELRRAADQLIAISQEQQEPGSKTSSANWEKYRSEAYMAALRSELTPEIKERGPEWAKTIRGILTAAGLPAEGAVPALIEARIADLAGRPGAKASQPKAPSPPANGTERAALERLAKKLDAELRKIFPGLYAVASVIKPGTPEQYVQGSVARSPRQQGRKKAKDAPRFFIVAQPARDGTGISARIREHHRNGFLAKEGISYPDEFRSSDGDVMDQIAAWLRSATGLIAKDGGAAGGEPRKTNAQVVYEALARTGPKATTSDVMARLSPKLPQAVLEKNLETLQAQGMAFSYGPSGRLGIHTDVAVLPFWATREQVLERGLNQGYDLPPIKAKWAPKPEPTEKQITEPTTTQPALRIDSPTAIPMLARIEGPAWVARQERDRKTMNDPTGFYANLTAYQILREMGEEAEDLVISDIVPSAGLIQGDKGRMYAVLPDGQIALYAETAADTDAAAAARVMMVV